MALRIVEKIRYMREFNQLCRKVAAENPGYSQDEVFGEAAEQMKAKYGADPNWGEILKMLMDFFMKFFPLLFLAQE